MAEHTGNVATDRDDFDPTDLEARRKAQEHDEEEQRLKRDEEIADFLELMGGVKGRRFMWRLLEWAGVNRTTFSTEGNGLEMAFREGNRNIGCFLMSEINAICPERYHVMVKENRHVKRRTASK